MRRPRSLRAIGKSLFVHTRSGYGAANVDPLDDVQPLPGMNKPETLITLTLNQMKIENVPQFAIGGGDIMGGGRADWILPQYFIDLEYNGPFHGTAEGKARDVLRNIGFQRLGYRIETIGLSDLPRLKQKLLEITGRPTGVR